MQKNWYICGLRGHGEDLLLMLIFVMVYQNLSSCWCLNEEGLALLRVRERIESDPFGALRGWHEYDGETDPCLWFGVECSNGRVVVLNLKDLCLGGTLAPAIGNLVHIKCIILRNNTFSRIIPEEIGDLEELGLDLGYNNFSGTVPYKHGSNLSRAIPDIGEIYELLPCLLDNNELLTATPPELYELKIISEAQAEKSLLSASAGKLRCGTRPTAECDCCIGTRDSIHRRVLAGEDSRKSHRAPVNSPSPSPRGHHGKKAKDDLSPGKNPQTSPPPVANSPIPSASPSEPPRPDGATGGRRRGTKSGVLLGASVGVSALLLFIILGVCLYRRSKVTLVRPWATGLSGQHRKAFVSGVPKLKRSELEIACEEFSNVVGNSSIGIVHKGTLSSAVEIAVASIEVESASEWSRNLETQFRTKIDMLARMNHMNSLNLIGYSHEESPFTRMMVFEYAPNGTLFEHLHIKEAEHLDWGTRVRIAMGMVYCLEHMHQLDPPIPHKNLTSSAVALTEDYAAKISDFTLRNHAAASEIESAGADLAENSSAGLETNVYDFGVILFEMVTGRIPHSADTGSTGDWASDYVRRDRPLAKIVDPSLSSFDADQAEKIGEIMRSCVNPDTKCRPSMREVSSRLRAVTGIPPGSAAPRISPLCWSELEISSN